MQRPGHKRAASDNAEASSSAAKAPSTKKTRFVDPSEDPANFEEQVDSALETSTRKGRVKNEGYDSDSSDDGEGVVNSRKKGAEGEDEDDDMFAMADKDDKDKDEGSKKKKAEFMRLGDIEGQEFGGGSGEESEDDPEDEDDAERRKKSGMGFELSSFNMRDEMEEGKFTDDGNYVRSVDVHAQHDRWMEGLDEKAIKLARRRKRQHEKEQRDKMLAEEQEIADAGGVHGMEKELLQYLRKGETLLEALQRQGLQAKKTKQKSKPSAKPASADAMNVDKQPGPPPAPTHVERMTHIASNIMSLGDTDIYTKTYEEIVRAVRSSGSVPADWEPPSADKKYEYKWDMPGAGQTDQTFGPYLEEEMLAWFKAQYFGSAGEKIKVREVDGEWKDWDELLP